MSKKQLSNLDFNNQSTAINLTNGVNPQDAVTMAQLTAAVSNQKSWKDDVLCATSSNINLASPGATLDGITMTLNSRVLVMGQTDATTNGPYNWNGASVPMTRTADGNTSALMEQAVMTVDQGSNSGATFRQSTVNITLGTSNLVFVAFGAASPSASETVSGTTKYATQTQTDAGTDNASAITPQHLAAWAGKPLKYNTTIGDGSATAYTVTHNLGTRNLQVTLSRATSPYDKVDADVAFTTTNTITVTFAVAPSANQFNVAILG